MIDIQEIKDGILTNKIEAHEEIGGAFRISVFEIRENYLGQLPDEYSAHLITARQTLEKQNFEWNFHFNKVAPKNQRKAKDYAYTDFDKLDPSGQKLSLFHFLGPHFDFKNMKPLIRGQLGNNTLNSYFYYDQDEIPENKVDINTLDATYRKLYMDNKGYFVHKLMEPPYNLNLGKEIYLRGEYLIEFLEYFFCNINDLTIYAWDTNCSVVFDAGKEWWGSSFWTVYNPTKKWYIGIIASETD